MVWHYQSIKGLLQRTWCCWISRVMGNLQGFWVANVIKPVRCLFCFLGHKMFLNKHSCGPAAGEQTCNLYFPQYSNFLEVHWILVTFCQSKSQYWIWFRIIWIPSAYMYPMIKYVPLNQVRNQHQITLFLTVLYTNCEETSINWKVFVFHLKIIES